MLRYHDEVAKGMVTDDHKVLGMHAYKVGVRSSLPDYVAPSMVQNSTLAWCFETRCTHCFKVFESEKDTDIGKEPVYVSTQSIKIES